MTLLLRRAETEQLLDFEQAVTLTAKAFSEQANGAADVHAPYHLNAAKGALRVVSGALTDTGRMGVRAGPNFTGGKGSLAMLYGTDGELLSVMSYPYSNLRVGAATAVSVEHMARTDARSIGLIGTGKLALNVLKGGLFARKIQDVRVYSRDQNRRERFCAQASATFGFAVQPVDTLRDAVADRDIVLTVTSSREPLFPFSWVARGTHISSMGPISELDAELLRRADRIVVGTKQHEKDYYLPAPPFPLVELIEAGELRWEDVAELGEVVAGKKPGRSDGDEITVFHESQGGFGDVMLASWIYDEARRRGVGQEFSF
jgi:alanine dehydrogenase